MNPAYLIAAIGSVCYGAADFAGGLGARRASAIVVTFFSGFAALLVLLVGLPFTPGVVRSSDMAWGVAAGAFGAAGAALIYRAIAIGPVSVASPVLCVSGLCLPVLVGVVLGERPSMVAITGVLLTPLAVALLAQDHREEGAPHSARRVLWPALQAGFTVGFFLVFMARIQPGAGLWPLIGARITAIAVLGAWLAMRRAPLAPPEGAREISLGAGALDSLANVAYVAAVQRGSLALVAALVSLSPATSVLLARAVLHERWSVPQRWGLAVALAAAVCISIG